MIKHLLTSALERFGRRYDYDTRYSQELVALDTGGGLKLALASPFLLHRFGAPKEIYFAAKLRSCMRADCGPCLGLVAAMAREAGVGTDTVLSALGKGIPSPDVALALRFADAVLDKAPDLPEVIREVRARFGERAHAGLAAAIVAGQFYPLLKRGLGHGASCTPVVQDLLAAQQRENLRHAAG